MENLKTFTDKVNSQSLLKQMSDNSSPTYLGVKVTGPTPGSNEKAVQSRRDNKMKSRVTISKPPWEKTT